MAMATAIATATTTAMAYFEAVVRRYERINV
jgi:hypothetical protein